MPGGMVDSRCLANWQEGLCLRCDYRIPEGIDCSCGRGLSSRDLASFGCECRLGFQGDRGTFEDPFDQRVIGNPHCVCYAALR